MHDESRSQRLPASDRRRQLIEIALDIFARKGYQGTTTKEIAAAAGVTEAIIFRHFPNKQALYTAVLDYPYETGETDACLATWKTFMDANDDAGLFRSIIATILESYRRDSRVKRAVLFAALEGHELGLELHRKRSMPVFDILCQYIARRQKEGAIRPENPAAIAGMVFMVAAHYAMVTEFFAFPTGATDPEAVDSFVNVLLNGILPQSSTEKVQ